LYEMKLVRATSGLTGMVGELGQGIRIWRKKPEILSRPRKIEGSDEVDRIYEALDTPPKEAP